MKQILFTTALLLAGIAVKQSPVLAQDAKDKAVAPNKSASSPIVLSEVCYWPKEGEPEWIELTNISDEAIDIKGWQLLDGQALDFVISEASFSLPPKAYMVVYLDGTGQAPTAFNQSKAIAHSPREFSGNLLGDKGGQVALYSPKIDVLNPAEIRSYVAWGRSPGRIISEALKAEKWSNTSASVFGTGPDLIWGPVKSIQQGGSIGLVEPIEHRGHEDENWGVFAPSEANPGSTGVAKRGPTLTRYAYDGVTTDASGYINISVVPMEEGVKYQFQVCADKSCKEIFLDHIGSNFDYRIEKPIPPKSTYFWRARLIYSDNVKSSWSEVRSFTRE